MNCLLVVSSLKPYALHCIYIQHVTINPSTLPMNLSKVKKENITTNVSVTAAVNASHKDYRPGVTIISGPYRLSCAFRERAVVYDGHRTN